MIRRGLTETKKATPVRGWPHISKGVARGCSEPVHTPPKHPDQPGIPRTGITPARDSIIAQLFDQRESLPARGISTSAAVPLHCSANR